MDVILSHGSPALHLDDEDEFEARRAASSYPPDLVPRRHAAAEDARSLFAKGDWPFKVKAY
ncbi:MAG: hypothetical protein NTW19_05900 [Planctomycetota bacterium]|nr:hypothetical protein [Planctomycetota bacterium]